MKSPKFLVRKPDLEKLFTESSLKNTWRKEVRPFLRKRQVPDPIEFMDFHVELSANCKRLSQQLCQGGYQPSSPIRILLEKSNGLCRQIVIASVDDALILQCLSDALYTDIKGRAPTKNSFFEPDDHKFSNRNKDREGAPQYGNFKAWLDFQKGILNFTKSYKYIIVTDVANFYDGISYSHLRNIMAGQIQVTEVILDALIYILAGLLWQPDYTPRVEIGLPQIDIDASRILAHCFLYELDDFLGNHMKVDFVRYMDDIDIGVDNISDGKRILRDVDLTLHTRQVRLNSGKTKIFSSSEAEKHFRIRDNRFIDRLNIFLASKLQLKKSIVNTNKIIAKRIKEAFFAKRFDGGSGEKILKRLITLSKIYDVKLDADILHEILVKRPSMRDPVLAYLTHRPMTIPKTILLFRYASNNQLVDDGAILGFSASIVEASTTKHLLFVKSIKKLVENLISGDFAKIYSAIWIGSKYLDSSELLNIVTRTIDVWRPNPTLGRLVGGMYPVFIATPEEKNFQKLISSSKNQAAELIYEFHLSICNGSKSLTAIAPVISAQNKSKLLGITHAKFLMMLTMISNPAYSDNQKKKLIVTHKKAWIDDFYRSNIIRVLPAHLHAFAAP